MCPSRRSPRTADLGRKRGVSHVRFRLAGKEHKKSLKTRDEAATRVTARLIEPTPPPAPDWPVAYS